MTEKNYFSRREFWILAFMLLLTWSSFGATDSIKSINNAVGYLYYIIRFGFWFCSALLLIRGGWLFYDGMIKTGLLHIVGGLSVFALPEIVAGWTAQIPTY